MTDSNEYQVEKIHQRLDKIELRMPKKPVDVRRSKKELEYKSWQYRDLEELLSLCRRLNKH